MNATELAAYHLGVQAKEIAQMKARTSSFTTILAGLEITVLPHVYPGGIDSELMCEAIGNVSSKSVLDICTGTGIVALTAARQGATEVIAVDLNPAAVQNAKINMQNYQLHNMSVREGSLFDPVHDQMFDVIAINPPYTGKKPSDKTEICFWDEDNQTTRQFFQQYQAHLNPGGKGYVGWADFSSLELLQDLAAQTDVRLETVASKATPSGLATFLVYELVAIN